MKDIKELHRIQETVKDGVMLLAVTKTRSPEEINQVIDGGVTQIGENKVQEILEKYDRVKPVRWHMIGHLQRNKVKYIIDKVDLIHSVDSLKLALEIDKRSAQHGRVMEILIQINAGDEENKFGIRAEELDGLAEEILEQCPHLRILGVMGVVPIVEDPEEARIYFKKIRKSFERLKEKDHPRLQCKYLSMGMSHDYMVAMEEGANIVRVGSAIFGPRVYDK